MTTNDEAFELAYVRTGISEGGLSLKREDAGNWTGGKVGKGELKGTKCGISAATYPNLDIKNLTDSEIKEIYYKDWWLKLKLDRFPSEMRYAFFDAAFHSGSYNAIRMWQRALQVKDDGIIGKKTMAASKAIDDLKEGILFIAQRGFFLAGVKNWDDFGRGYMNRLMTQLMYYAKDNM